MDSLMRFAVLSPAARELVGEGERTSGGAGVVEEDEQEEEEKDGEISRVVVCTRVRTSVKEDGGWAGWRPRHTTREATRAFPVPGTTPHLPPASRSFAICATRTSSPPQYSFSSAEKQFSLYISHSLSLFFFLVSFPLLPPIYFSRCARAHVSPMSFIVRLSFIRQTSSAVFCPEYPKFTASLSSLGFSTLHLYISLFRRVKHVLVESNKISGYYKRNSVLKIKKFFFETKKRSSSH